MGVTGSKKKILDGRVAKIAYNGLGLGEEAVPECSIELLMLKFKTNVQ